MNTPNTALEIITLFRGTVLDVQHLAPGERFTIGGDGADLPLDHPALTGDAPHALAGLDPDGRARVDILPGVTASVLVDGAVHPVERAGGLRLVPGQKARVDLGDTALLFGLVRRAADVPRGPLNLLDRDGRRFFGAAAALHAAVLAIAFSVPVQAGSLNMDGFQFENRWVDIELMAEQEKPIEDWASQIPEEPVDEAGGGDVETTWTRKEPVPTGNDGAPAPGETEDERAIKKQIARDTADAVGEALDGLMPDGDLGASAHAALDGLNGGDRGQAMALGGWGDTLNQIGGPGLRPGPSGGPSVGVRIATRGAKDDPRYGRVPGGKIPKKRSKPPVVIPQDPEVIGGLSREEIQKVVRRNRNAVRYCYEKELQSHPDLEGKVRMKFMVGADGRVLTAVALDSTLGVPGIDRCIAQRMRTWQFPAVRGGGAVVVTYPFLFRSGR